MSLLLRSTLGLFLVILIVESGLRIVRKDPPAPELFRVFPADWVSKLDWYADWEKDHSRLRRTFKAYEIYGLRPQAGEVIRIEEDGYRRTWKPNAPSSLSIGMFGGSTLWGSWARNDHTIPSYLAKELGSTVKNYGEVGFVLSQELHRAVRLLNEGQSHSAYVFFNGVNDTLSAAANFAHGIERPAGLPWEYDKYENLFALGKTGEIGVSDILMKSKAYRTARNILREKNPDEKGYWRNPTPEDFKRISQEVAREYVSLVRTTDKVVRSFGVTPVFVLQPLIGYKKHLTPSEKPLLEANASWSEYIHQVYEEIRTQTSTTNFLDYSALFAEETEDMFSDVIHYSELGNKKIAAKLSSDLTAILKMNRVVIP